VDLGEIIFGFLPILRRTIHENVEIALDARARPALVNADAGQVEQLLLNLAVNAQDAMPMGGRLLLEIARGVITDSFAALHPGLQPGHCIILSCSDTGEGMDTETQAHIFEPFFTTKETGKGTGLGLASVYGTVRQHGGVITVDSVPGRGTTFRVYFPCAEVAASAATEAGQPAVAKRGNETIIVVEDNSLVRELTVQMLQILGYHALAFSSGPDCLEAIRCYDGPMDMLLTDVVMPTMNGRELYQCLAQLKPNLRVLYMTGYARDAIAKHGILEKGTHLVQKPFTLMTLGAKVRERLDSQRAGNE